MEILHGKLAACMFIESFLVLNPDTSQPTNYQLIDRQFLPLFIQSDYYSIYFGFRANRDNLVKVSDERRILEFCRFQLFRLFGLQQVQ